MKRIEIEIVEGTRDDGRRLRRIVEILAGGIYAFLEEEGYLKEVEERASSDGAAAQGEGEEVRSPHPGPPPQGGRGSEDQRRNG